MIGIALLGSTGSIGTQTLDVIRTHRSASATVGARSDAPPGLGGRGCAHVGPAGQDGKHGLCRGRVAHVSSVLRAPSSCAPPVSA